MQFEHRVGADLLNRLLVRSGHSALDDAYEIAEVVFQTGDPVDDLRVHATGPNGDQLTLFVAARRKPGLRQSDPKFVTLAASMLDQIAMDAEAFLRKKKRLGLAVRHDTPSIGALSQLCVIARECTDGAEFGEAVDAPGAYNPAIRDRYARMLEVVAKARAGQSDGVNRESLWALLHACRIISCRLEADDQSDVTAAVDRLGLVNLNIEEGTAAQTALQHLASEYGTHGASVNGVRLRRDLQPHAQIGRARRSAEAWRLVDDLQAAAQVSTRRLVTPSGEEVILDRADLAQALSAAIYRCGTATGVLAITGEPSTGKSAAALGAAADLVRAGEVVLRLNLRDLPGGDAGLEIGFRQLLDAINEAPVAACRALLIDGCEAIAEGRDRTLKLLAAHAAAAGVGLIVIVRDDLLDEVEALLGGPTIDRFVVGPLTDDELDQLADLVPALRPALRDARSRQVVSRIGVAALLVQSEQGADVGASLSEAVVMRRVWTGVILGREASKLDASSDDRAAATEAAARQALGIRAFAAPFGHALERLRLDGILGRPPADAPWEDGLQFADDAIRDLAVAWVLLKDDFAPLRSSAPKWALRAARIAAQARLENAGDAGVELDRLQALFNSVASSSGDRWSEIPTEALVTVRSPHVTLQAAGGWLLADHSRMQRLLRVLRQRHKIAFDALDPVVATPVLDLIADRVGEFSRYSDVGRDSEKALLRWLEGLAIRSEDASNPTRQRFAELLSCQQHPSREVVEAVALLGPDLGPGADMLRVLANNAPVRLLGAVESVLGPFSLARHHPELLLELVPAYYIEEPDTDRWGGGLFRNGIRHFRHGHQLGHPFAAPHYGPFWHMLNRRPVEALAVIDQIVAHALSYNRPLEPTVTLDFPGAPGRVFVGDLDGWGWYRGLGNGPHPCMSALMAVERFADHLVSIGISPSRVIDNLLRETQTTAMLAIAVGFATRHLESVDNYLAAFLSVPMLWDCEMGRAAAEAIGLHAGPRDDEQGVHPERRSWDFRELGARLVGRALLADDANTLERFAAARKRFLANLEPLDSESRTKAEIAVCVLDRANYRRVELEGQAAVLFELPTWAAAIVEERRRPIERTGNVYELMNRYSKAAADPKQVRADIVTAQELEADPPNVHRPEDAITLVAGAAIRAHATASVQVPKKDLVWAATVVQRAVGTTADDLQYYPRGCDRTAAAAVAVLLMPRFHEASPTMPVVHLDDVIGIAEGLLDHGSDEVRRILCLELNALWPQPCGPGAAGTETCRHRVALSLLELSARRCRLGPYDVERGESRIVGVGGPLDMELDKVPAEELVLTSLPGALAGTVRCALSGCCAAETARPLAHALVRAHRRSAAHWEDEGFDFREWDSEPIAEALLAFAAVGDPALVDTAVYLADHPRGLTTLLHDLTRLATYDPTLRRQLADEWPALIDGVTTHLSTVQRDERAMRNWSSAGDQALASLVPVQRFNLSEMHHDEVLEQSRPSWPGFSALADASDNWLLLAEGIPECVDAVARLARFEEDPSTALAWVERLIDGHAASVANRTAFLHLWLGDLADAELDPSAASSLERVVDSLAAAGDDHIARLQRE